MHTGLDRLADDRALVKKVRGARIALLAHPASVSRSLVHVADVLEGVGARPVVVFGPEHGYGGEAQDMIGVADARDLRGTRIKSLYGDRFDDLSPTDADLADVDTLVIDLQDVGARYYTFVWTAVLVMRACARLGKRVLVLDRPNPLGCDDDAIEGRCQEPGFLSFVGLERLPVRHAMTLGEIVAWRAAVEHVPKGLVEVVGVRGLDRGAHAVAWDRPFVLPSPNMPSYETARVYPGGCLIEGTNLSEGRGTTRPFELVGAPFLDGPKLARDLENVGLAGVRFRPVTFLPMFQKHAGAICGGVQIHPVHVSAFRPYATYLALVALAHAQAAHTFRFRTERYEFVDDIPAFDLLTGSSRARTMIEAGVPCQEIIAACAESDADLAHVRDARRAGEDSFV